jgi:S-adenosylmethionine synthetase
MSLEGTNGKNPRYYSGFVYANLTKRLAKRLHNEFKREVVVEIVSQNGGDLFDPWQSTVKMDHGPDDEKRIKRIVRESFEEIPTITEDFLTGEITTW